MRSRFLRGAATATTNHLNAATLKQLAMEFLVIVAGILAAFGVDSWRQDREELRVLNAHLSDLAAEVQNNIWTIETIQTRALERKIRNLETVLQFLGNPGAPVENAAELRRAFAGSTAATTPWLRNNQFQAMQNSGDLRLLRDQDLAGDIAGTYAAPEVLLSQVARIQGTYPRVVNELIPAHLQAEFSQLRGYVGGTTKAPVLKDAGDPAVVLDSIRARRDELQRLARNEAAVATGQWYALTRLKIDFEGLLERLRRRDGVVVSVERPPWAR
jgi:hypothetical protein